MVGRDQPDQILYLKKDPQTQIWNLERMENELYKEPPDPMLEAVAKLVSSECREWVGSPSELAEAIQTGMASNALTKYLNVKSGRLLEEYHVGYENKARHSGRRVKLTYMSSHELRHWRYYGVNPHRRRSKTKMRWISWPIKVVPSL